MRAGAVHAQKADGCSVHRAGGGQDYRHSSRRRLLSVVIQLAAAGNHATEEHETFAAYAPEQLSGLTAGQVRENLLASGLWTALRTRPYSKIPDPAAQPAAIFITAMDTNPLAADLAPIIREQAESFHHGLTVLAHLTTGSLWVCKAPEADFPLPGNLVQLRVADFAGPHPAGLVGTHIHFLAPVDASKTIWYLKYQEVISIGKLFVTGRLWTERVIALGGPQVSRPRLLCTRLGASLDDLLRMNSARSPGQIAASSPVRSGPSGRLPGGRLIWAGIICRSAPSGKSRSGSFSAG